MFQLVRRLRWIEKDANGRTQLGYLGGLVRRPAMGRVGLEGLKGILGGFISQHRVKFGLVVVPAKVQARHVEAIRTFTPFIPNTRKSGTTYEIFKRNMRMLVCNPDTMRWALKPERVWHAPGGREPTSVSLRQRLCLALHRG